MGKEDLKAAVEETEDPLLEIETRLAGKSPEESGKILEEELRKPHQLYDLARIAKRMCFSTLIAKRNSAKLERYAHLSLEAFVRSGHPEGAIALVLWLRDFSQQDALSSKVERMLINSYGRKARPKKAVDDHLPPPTPYQEFSASVSFEDFPAANDFYREQLRQTEKVNFPLFSNLKTAEVARLLRVAELRHLKAGEYLFKEGEQALGFFILAEGKVSLKSQSGFQKECGPGDFIGDLALFCGMTHTASARAEEESHFIVFPQDKLLQCFKVVPRLREELNDLFHRRLFLAQAEQSLIFSLLDREDLDKCWEFFVPIHVSQGHTLMEPGMFADRFFLILRGKIEVTRTGQPPVYLGPGHFLGERGLILKTTRNAMLTTISDCDLLECDRWSFQELMEFFPFLREKIEERRPDYEKYQFSARNFVLD